MLLRYFGLSLAASMMIVGGAQAGGFSRGNADTDILYEPGGFNFRSGATVVYANQKYKTARNPALVGENPYGTYIIPSAAVKLNITENLACAGTYTDAYGANASHSEPFHRLYGKLSEGFTVSEFGATCAAFINVGKGRLSILGGIFQEHFNYDLNSLAVVSLNPLIFAPLEVELGSRAYGWRAGIGYEIPEIAFRSQLLYRSGSEHSASGTAWLGPNQVDATGYGKLPQSVEFKLQSGIAPGWMAFGSVKWTDWSVNETLDLHVLAPGFPAIINQYYWRDGWTVSAGVGHSFTEQVSGLVSIQWDRGVSTGYDLQGDRWALGTGVSMKDSWGGQLRMGAGIAYLEGKLATVGDQSSTELKSGWATSFSASYSVNW